MSSLKELYYRCFDEDGNVKNCGRQNCINLIVACQKFGDRNYGDIITGYMNIENIKQLMKEVD